jgi:hypothetical protein
MSTATPAPARPPATRGNMWRRGPSLLLRATPLAARSADGSQDTPPGRALSLPPGGRPGAPHADCAGSPQTGDPHSSTG